MRIKKRLEGLERAFEILVHQTEKEQIRYTTYMEEDKKYLVLFGVGNGGITWSKHFIIEEIADDKSINPQMIDNEALFKNSIPL